MAFKIEQQTINDLRIFAKNKGSVLTYTYTPAEGITDDRQCMILIKNEGILGTINNKKIQRIFPISIE